MMHLRPELVKRDKAMNFESSAAAMPRDGVLQRHALGFGVKTGWLSQDLNPHGVVGDASGADAGLGAELVESSALGLARLIEEMHGTCADEWTGATPLYPPQGSDES
jgi:creatinine amidohydrolase